MSWGIGGMVYACLLDDAKGLTGFNPAPDVCVLASWLLWTNKPLPRELSLYDKRLRENEELIAKLQDDLSYLQNEVIFDPETRIYSPSYFHVRLQEEIVRSERYRHFLSLVFDSCQFEEQSIDPPGHARDPADRGGK